MMPRSTRRGIMAVGNPPPHENGEHMYSFSSLNAHSLTRGQRIIIHTEPAIGGTQDRPIITLGDRNTDDQVDRVTNVRITGQRMRVFLASGWMIYCGINDTAAVVL